MGADFVESVWRSTLEELANRWMIGPIELGELFRLGINVVPPRFCQVQGDRIRNRNNGKPINPPSFLGTVFPLSSRIQALALATAVHHAAAGADVPAGGKHSTCCMWSAFVILILRA